MVKELLLRGSRKLFPEVVGKVGQLEGSTLVTVKAVRMPQPSVSLGSANTMLRARTGAFDTLGQKITT